MSKVTYWDVRFLDANDRIDHSCVLTADQAAEIADGRKVVFDAIIPEEDFPTPGWAPQITPLDNPTASKSEALIDWIRELLEYRTRDDDGDLTIAGCDLDEGLALLDAYDGKPPRPVQVWSAGWNVPGYMPDEEPHHFRTWEDAAAWLDDELARAGDCAREDGTQKVVDQYTDAQLELENMRGGTEQAHLDNRSSFYARVGNYLWWIEHVTLPAGEEPNW